MLAFLLLVSPLAAYAQPAAYGEPGCAAKVLPTTRSIGTPIDGSLDGARELPDAPGLARLKAEVFGTAETVALLLAGTEAVRAAFPGSTPLAIGKLSGPRGGRLRPHKSHRTGRDVDAGYYDRRLQKARWTRPGPKHLDVARVWLLLQTWLATGRLQYVFVDHRLQRVLYKHAKQQGMTDADLQRIFQYPRSRRARIGVIRHERGHRDHLHIRFHCPIGDGSCEDP